MSGCRHSGLTQEEYEDREVLRKAAEVVRRRFPLEGALELLLCEVLERAGKGQG